MAVRFGFKFFRGLVHMRTVNDNTVPLHSLLGSNEDGNGISKSIHGPANKIAYIDMIYDKNVIEKPYLEANTVGKFVAEDCDGFISADISNKLTDSKCNETCTFFKVNENNTNDYLKKNSNMYTKNINKKMEESRKCISRKNAIKKEILKSKNKKNAVISKSYQYRYSKIKLNCISKQKYPKMQSRSINCGRFIANQKNMLAGTLSKMSNSKIKNNMLNNILQQVIIVQKPTKEYLRNKNSLKNCKITPPSIVNNYFYTGNVLSQKISTHKHNSCDSKRRMISTASTLKYEFSKPLCLKRPALSKLHQPAAEKTSYNYIKAIEKPLKELQSKNDSSRNKENTLTKLKKIQKKRKTNLGTAQNHNIQSANFKLSSEFELSYAKAMEDVTKLRKDLVTRYKNEDMERKQSPNSSKLNTDLPDPSICHFKYHSASISNISNENVLDGKDYNISKAFDEQKEVKLNCKSSESKDHNNLGKKSAEAAGIKIRSLHTSIVANKPRSKKDNNFENFNKIKVKNIIKKVITKGINPKLNEEKFISLKLYIEKLKHAKTREKNVLNEKLEYKQI